MGRVKRKKRNEEIYLVNVTILEGRHYAWPNMDSYVHTRVGNQTKCTKIRIGTDAPFYNEYYVFEFNVKLQNLLDKNVTLAVFRPGKIWRRKKCLGYITIDVATIWEQSGNKLYVDHQFFRKWAVICSTESDFNGPRGYLKVTLSILAKGESPIQPVINPFAEDEIEGNLLLPDGLTLERQRCQYIFKVYHAEDLSKCSGIIKNLKKHEKAIKKAFVEVSFAGLTAKTASHKHSASTVWNEALILHELFPPLCQRVRVVLNFMDSKKKVKSVRYLNIHSIANDKEHGFLPTFGPAYIYFYATEDYGENYIGRVLVSFETKLSNENEHTPKAIKKQVINSLIELDFWRHDEVLLFAAIFDATLINKKFTNKPITFEMLFGNPYNKKEESLEGAVIISTPPQKPLSKSKQFWYLCLDEQKPCLRISALYPDLRRRLYNANMIFKIAVDLKQHLDNIEKLFVREEFKFYNSDLSNLLEDMFEFLAAACRKYIDITSTHGDNFNTNLDREKTLLCLREMEDIERLARSIYNPRLKKKSFRKAQKMYRRLEQLIDHPQACWPDIFLWMKYGKKRVACEKIEAKDLVFSTIEEEKGQFCGKIHNIYFKTNRKQKYTSPIACKITIMFWLGLRRHKTHCLASIPEGYSLPTDKAKHLIPDELLISEKHVSNSTENWEAKNDLPISVFQKFQCRAHLYQGRFEQGYDDTGLSDYYCRISVDEQCLETKVIKATLNPVWDQVLHFKCFSIFGSQKQIKQSPPIIVVEVCDQDNCCTAEFAGRGTLKPVVKLLYEEYIKPDFPPKLQWIDIKHDTGIAGQVLAAVELLELDPDSPDVDDHQSKHIITIPDDIKPVLVSYRLEVFFWGVRQLKKNDGLPIVRAKIDLELSGEHLRSETLHNARKYLNFEQPVKSMDILLSSFEDFIPPISIKMYECRSFGRNSYVGCCLTYAQQFLYHPISEAEYGLRISGFEQQSYDSFNSKAASIERLAIPEVPLLTMVDISGAGDATMNQLISSTQNSSNAILENNDYLQTSMSQQRKYVPNTLAKEKCKNCVKGKCPYGACISPATNISLRDNKSSKAADNLQNNDDLNKPATGIISTFVQKHKKGIFGIPFASSSASILIEPTEDIKDLPTDWWAKYYASTEQSVKQKKDYERPNFKLKIYSSELEKQAEFGSFKKLLQTFGIYKGKRTGDDVIDQQFRKAVVKIAIKLYRWPPENNVDMVTPTGLPLENGYFQHYPSNETKCFLLRVYCVKGVKLRPLDRNGKCDSFLCIIMNDQKIKDVKNYIPKQINPVYGKCFELKGVFPRDTKLTVQVWDWDRTSKNDLIGETEIDIETRLYSIHRPNCGLQYEYTQETQCFWRDQFLPTKILEDRCRGANLPCPVFRENSVQIGYKIITKNLEAGETIDNENLALHVLHQWKEMPIVGCDLVPDHVETRSLYHPAKPGIEQGKLEMWIDLFTLGDNPPPKIVDISPRKPEPYELRIIIYNTEDVLLKDDDFFLGEKKSDIYVKAWLHKPNKPQRTDIHYRSLTGEGNFNWRFVFPFHYLRSENKITLIQKGKFDIDETEQKLPCSIKIQIWDNDTFSPDDFIGFLTMDVTRLYRGARTSKKCTLKNIENDAPTLNLFKIKRCRGWWPMKTIEKKTNKTILAGKLEAEFHLLTGEEASLEPVGLGRNEPQALPPPNRPNTSFQWFKNPLKSLRFIICKHYKCNIIIGFIGFLIVAFVLMMIFAFPGYSVKKLLRV